MQKDRKKSIEIEAVTVEKAIDRALKELGAKKKNVEIQILKEEQKGLFGMKGAKTAKIKATLKKEA